MSRRDLCANVPCNVTTATTSAPSLQIEYDRDVPALLVQYWCRDGAAALDDAPDDAAQQATSFARSSSAVGVRSTTNLMKLALESVAPGAAAAAAAAAAMHRSQSTMRLRAVPSTNAAAAAAASNATTDGDYAFCVTVRNGSLVVAHVPPIVADATSAALIDEAVKRLDFVALLRHVVDARAHVSLTSVARAVAHVLAEQRSLSAEPSVRASVAVQRAASNLATSGSAPPRMLLQLDGATICVLTRDRTTGAVLASEAVRDIAAFVTPAWWQAAVRVGSNEVASADAADLDTVRRGCVSLWARAALEQLRLCASARGCFAAQLRPRSVGARTAHRRQSVLLPLAGTHFESSVRVCLDDTLQPVAQLVLLSSAATVAGAVPSGATNAQFDAVAEYGERLVRCVPLSVASAVNGIDSSGGGGGGHVRRRRRLNADDAWVASALREGAALAWSTDFEAQLARLGTSHEQYMPDETTFALTLAGAATPVRCTVTRRVADETVEWLVNTDLGIVAGDASDARLRSPHLRSSGVSGTVWSFGNDVHAARGVVRTGVMSARVGAAVRSVKHAAAKAGCSVDAAGDVGVRLSLADGATRVSLGWRTDVPASGAFADAWLETNDGAIDRFFGPALRALVGAVDARSERLSGLHELLLSRVARLSDMAGALERLCAEHRDVRVVVLTLLGSVSVLVVVLQRYGIVVRSPDGRNKLRLSDATSEGATSLGNLESWSRWIDAQHSALSASGAGDLFDKLSVLRSTLIAVVRLADLARTMRARMTVSLDANGRRLTFVPANGVQNELAVNGDGSLSLMIMQSSGQPATIIVGGLDDVAAASRSISALIAAQAFLPPSLVDDALTHLARNVATLLLSLNVDGSALDGVESDSGFSRLNLTLQYYDARQQQRRLVLQLSGETGEWVWSYACVAPPPLRFVQVALFDNGTERKLGFLDNFLEAQRLVPN
jgi:hypothetical protein